MNESSSYEDVYLDEGSIQHSQTSPQPGREISDDDSDAKFSPGPDLPLAISDSSGDESTGTPDLENNSEPSVSFPFQVTVSKMRMW